MVPETAEVGRQPEKKTKMLKQRSKASRTKGWEVQGNT